MTLYEERVIEEKDVSLYQFGGVGNVSFSIVGKYLGRYLTGVPLSGTTAHLHVNTILMYYSGDRAETETIDRPKNWHT